MNPHHHQQHLPPPQQPTTSSSLKTRFALRFIQSLKNFRTPQNPISSKKMNTITVRRRRCRRIKIAADASMASLIGTRRVWSRTLLTNLRIRQRTTPTPTTTTTTTINTAAALKKNKNTPTKRKKKKKVISSSFLQGKRKLVIPTTRETQLRNLVPGGTDMDACTLLDETAHYIQCLATQVMVMRNLVDYCSSTPPPP